MNRMDYETAKRLKDAGFPQEPTPNGGFLSQGPQPIRRDEPIKIAEQEKLVYFPTLTELIEACGDGTAVIRLSPTESNAWTKQRYHPDDGPLSCTGPTPEIAVANLWLAMNLTSPN